MAEKISLTNPWLVAVWPGMGHVALNAGYYLLSKLSMNAIAEYEVGDLFDVDAVEVKDGVIQPVRLPRNRFFVWKDPNKKRDLVIFLGEAQPPLGKFAFCRHLIAFAQELGVERVFTFAAMATQMHPTHLSRVFGAATGMENVHELKQLENLTILKEGNISGLNGVFLGAAAEKGMHGTCLLGEMPHILSQLPFPKASLAILEAFGTLSGIDVDLSEMSEQANIMEEHLGELLARVEESIGRKYEVEEEAELPEPQEISRVRPEDRQRIEELFMQATKDRARAFELKRELDRMELFKEYEDRFLDLFKKSDADQNHGEE